MGLGSAYSYFHIMYTNLRIPKFVTIFYRNVHDYFISLTLGCYKLIAYVLAHNEWGLASTEMTINMCKIQQEWG